MAPEILSSHKYDAKADLWSVGTVLYEMSVGKPPFRASNHIDLLRRIEHSKGIKFPDEDPTHQPRPGEDSPQVVPPDVKALIRALLRRNPAERASFEDFFGSEAIANSKFSRPTVVKPPSPPSHEPVDDGKIPDHHLRVPPEVLDPHAMIPPSKFHFRRRESEATSHSREGSSSRYVIVSLLCERGLNFHLRQPSQGTHHGACSFNRPRNSELISYARIAAYPETIVD
jgi:serine/threonine-protein kinase ULK/ATG1